MKIGEKRRFSIRFACSYLILLIIPAIMGISAYRSSVQLSCANVIESNEMALRQLGESLDNSLNTAGQFAFSLSSVRQSLLSVSSLRDQPGEQTYAVRTIIDELPIHMDSNGLTDDYFIVEYKSDVIVSPCVGYLSSYDYYASRVRPLGVDYSSWYESLFNTRLTHVEALESDEGDALLQYCYPFSLFNLTRPSYSVVFTLDGNALNNLMAPILDLGAAQLCILNDSEEILLNAGERNLEIQETIPEKIELSGSSFERRIKGERMLISCWKGDYFALVSAIPYAVIARSAYGVLRTVLLYLVLYILAEILLCAWIIRRNQRPVSRMLEHLEAWNEKKPFTGSWNNVEHAVESLSQNAKLLESDLQSQTQLLRTAYINRLMYGDIINESETEKQLEQVRFAIEGGIMRGIYMHWKTTTPSTEAQNYLRAQIIDILGGFAPELSFINLNSAHRFALLYTAQEVEDDRHKELLQALYSRLKLEMSVDVSFFVGHSCTRTKNVHESFSAASALMNNAPNEEKQFLFESEEMLSGSTNLNLVREEQKLMNLLTVGSMDEIDAFLGEMYRRYFGCGQMNEFERKLFYYRMIGALIAVHHDLQLLPELKYSISSLSPREFFSLIHRQCERICQMNQERKLRQANELVCRIAEHIDQNFANPEISLYSIAVEFSLTESYLSQLIKEKLGETFSSRVERLRIEKATQLLCETDLRIEAISEAVGYANANTFRRAFRRIQGFSPSDYRTERRDAVPEEHGAHS